MLLSGETTPQPLLQPYMLRLQQLIMAARAQGSDFSPPSDGPLSSPGWAEEDESDGEEDFSMRVRPRLAS